MPPAIRLLLASSANTARAELQTLLQGCPELNVVAMAGDIFSALDAVKKVNPDVMILDLEMPGGGSLALLHKVMKSHPTHIIALFSDTADGQVAAAQALAVGAADTQVKSSGNFHSGALIEDLAIRIFRVAQSRVNQAPKPSVPSVKAIAKRSSRPKPKSSSVAANPKVQAPSKPSPVKAAASSGGRKIIVVGASTGGTQALAKMLEPLPLGLPGIAIVQHMPADFTGRLADRLNRCCTLTVVEAEDGMLFEYGHAYIAPGGQQFSLSHGGGTPRIKLDDGPEVGGHKPSVGFLFDSVQPNHNQEVMAIMLTGMGGDGSAAMKRLHDQGALTVAQDEASCVVFGMPREVIRLGGASHILPLLDIPQAIIGFGVEKTASRGAA